AGTEPISGSVFTTRWSGSNELAGARCPGFTQDSRPVGVPHRMRRYVCSREQSIGLADVKRPLRRHGFIVLTRLACPNFHAIRRNELFPVLRHSRGEDVRRSNGGRRHEPNSNRDNVPSRAKPSTASNSPGTCLPSAKHQHCPTKTNSRSRYRTDVHSNSSTK